MLSSWVLGLIVAAVLFIVLFLLFRRKEGTCKGAILSFSISIVTFFATRLFANSIDTLFSDIGKMAFSKSDDVIASYIDESSDLGSPSPAPVHIHQVYAKTREQIIPATCTDPGSYVEVELCECGEEVKREKVNLQPLGHDYRPVKSSATCTESGYTTYTCSRCRDSYVNDYVDALGHDFVEGICQRCGYHDPDYVVIYDSKKIISILADSVVSNSGTFGTYLGADTISVFAEDKTNCFSINTAVSYNLWGGNVQNVIFNTSNLSEISRLSFDIGGQTGTSGKMLVKIYIDKALDESPDYSCEIEASAIPTSMSIDISDSKSLGFEVTNMSGNENRIVFFNFYGE